MLMQHVIADPSHQQPPAASQLLFCASYSTPLVQAGSEAHSYLTMCTCTKDTVRLQRGTGHSVQGWHPRVKGCRIMNAEAVLTPQQAAPRNMAPYDTKQNYPVTQSCTQTGHKRHCLRHSTCTSDSSCTTVPSNSRTHHSQLLNFRSAVSTSPRQPNSHPISSTCSPLALVHLWCGLQRLQPAGTPVSQLRQPSA